MVLKFPTEQSIDFGHIVQWVFSSSNLPIVTLCFCFIIFPSINDRCAVSESQFCFATCLAICVSIFL